jgi:hypothetical protein
MNAHLRLSVFAACLFASPAIAAAQGTLAVTVFEDRNGNGSRDASERPLAGVVVSNQDDAVATDASGVARLGRGPGGVAFV